MNRSTIIQTILDHYLVALLFFSNGRVDEEEVENFDGFSLYQIDPPCKEKAQKLVEEFYDKATTQNLLKEDVDYEQVGHDLFLTHNGHGVGFWSRDDETYGEENKKPLSDLATSFKEIQEVWAENDVVHFQ